MPHYQGPSDEFLKQALQFKVESSQHYKGKGGQLTLGAYLHAMLEGWRVRHLHWNALKKEAARRGVDTSKYFRRGLGRQFDDLQHAIGEAERMAKDYGVKPRTSGLVQRLARIRATIDEYVGVCRQHGNKSKRTEQEAQVWAYLAHCLQLLHADTKHEEEAVQALSK